MIRSLVLAAALIAVAAPASSAESVAVPAFNSIQLAGGGNVVVRPGPRQRVTIVSGSTSFTRFEGQDRGRLGIDTCNARCPRVYRLQLVIESPRVPDLAITGGGTITAAAGFAPQPQLSAAIRGGGVIDATRVRATGVSAAISGGGDIRVAPRSSLSAAIHGGGVIAYSGNPKVSSAVVGGGRIARLR